MSGTVTRAVSRDMLDPSLYKLFFFLARTFCALARHAASSDMLDGSLYKLIHHGFFFFGGQGR